jgi:6-methylsalicylate decarboxylase
MDDAGIDIAITSISTPGVHMGDDSAARDLARRVNYGNTFARTPSVKYIFSHAGGTIPYLATRFSIIDEMNVIPGAEERGTAADTLRRLYWVTASEASPLS